MFCARGQQQAPSLLGHPEPPAAPEEAGRDLCGAGAGSQDSWAGRSLLSSSVLKPHLLCRLLLCDTGTTLRAGVELK